MVIARFRPCASARLLPFLLGLLAWLCAAAALAAPCTVREQDSARDLRSCVTALSADEFARAMPIAVQAGAASKVDGNCYRIDVDGSGGKRVLDVGIPDAYQLQAYQLAAGHAQTVLQLDEHSRFAERPVQHRRLFVPLQLPAGPSSIFVYYHTHAKTPMVARLLTQSQLLVDEAESSLFNGIMFGIMLVALPLLALGLGTHDRSYRLYAALVLTTLLFIAQLEGYGFQFVWPDSPVWNMRAPLIAATAMLACHIGFALRFLHMKSRMPRLYRAHLLVLALVAATLPFALLGPIDAWVVTLSAAYSALSVISAREGVRQNIPAARFYLMGILSQVLFMVGLLTCSLWWFNPLPQISVLSYPKMGYLGEAMLFAAAVVSQVRQYNERQAEARVRRLAETEQLLQAEQSKLAALEKAKQQQLQLASASHDISQPLASLRFAIAALAQQAEHQPLTEHIDNTLNYAQTLLKDLMGQARQDQHAPDTIDLHAMFEQLTQEFEPAVLQKGLRLRVRRPRLQLDGSALLLYRILNNLLANALRYTARGRIVLGARRRFDAVEIQVWDSGPGIPLDTQEALLQAFQQGQQGGAGFGLGLFIVKKLCEQCGYRLRIVSVLGRGSGFCLTIPLSAPD
ncbi:MAG: 7TM diverse intracellular signaling domain-containing protein [Pseudomonadota bacterium]